MDQLRKIGYFALDTLMEKKGGFFSTVGKGLLYAGVPLGMAVGMMYPRWKQEDVETIKQNQGIKYTGGDLPDKYVDPKVTPSLWSTYLGQAGKNAEALRGTARPRMYSQSQPAQGMRSAFPQNKEYGVDTPTKKSAGIAQKAITPVKNFLYPEPSKWIMYPALGTALLLSAAAQIGTDQAGKALFEGVLNNK